MPESLENTTAFDRGFAGYRREHSNCGVGVLMDLTGKKTHRTVRDALTILQNLDHRGARGAEENTGDGAGILLQKPHEFFQEVVPGLPDFDDYGVAMIFFPRKREQSESMVEILDEVIEAEGFTRIAWRKVPTKSAGLGRTALDTEPSVRQLFLKPRVEMSPETLDVRFYLLMRVMEKAIYRRKLSGKRQFYICSIDRRKIVYKGLLTNAQVAQYYPDLQDERVKSSLALVHSRFSTNTLGSWPLAHPYRNIVHNGEINTYRGNFLWMRAREADLQHPFFGDRIDDIKPVSREGMSDTALLDNVLELIVESGRSLAHALRMVIPEAWNKDPLIDQQKRDWYDYHSTLVEPWDGPALVAFTDGYNIGAALDRNGFRPCRYAITRDQRLIMASEMGVLPLDPAEVVKKGRLKPGQMFYADGRQGKVFTDAEIFAQLTDQQYGQWLRDNRVRLAEWCQSDAARRAAPKPGIEDPTIWQASFGYTLEFINRLILPMAEDGKDPVGAMGDDTPAAVLSNRTKTLFHYFKQHFAQVSNPPIDYIREELVTSLESHIGKQGNFLAETPEHCRQVHLRSPILSDEELRALEVIDVKGIRSAIIDITYPRHLSLYRAMERIRERAVQAIEDGFEILIFSDRALSAERIAIPILLAVSGVHHELIRQGLRMRASLVVESGQPCAVHHFCTLLGYGADAINPYLVYATLASTPAFAADPAGAGKRYREAVEDGILKVMSKMGISTLQSYKGAQIFEALGLDPEFIADYFTGTVSRIGGIGLPEIEEDCQRWHKQAFTPLQPGTLRLDQGGDLYWRRDGEFHQWNPVAVGMMQHAVRQDDEKAYREFARISNRQEDNLQTLRGLLDFKVDEHLKVPLEEVEPVEAIFKRFFTGSMSWGALSQEAHETLAIAMNRIGAYACSGEGGEQVDRFGTERECKNKQVASGRFGVTAHYLANAHEIEIKMAQGAKPGEGGQLPGEKVDREIARVRFTTPGVGLISPPPHHDIYSIEDLAQLIHDLKCANPDASVQVKLVSEAGVGTIAAGVAKARADSILIAGDSGGTGAAAKTSIKSTGLPWELGLAEANQVLLENRLRSRVSLRTDGGLRTGRDVVMAALLGAEAYGFGTSALVALGCIMLRKCHCNTCSVGVATQNPELRKRFPGKPEHVIRYMTFIAREVREIMASLGFRSMEEMIGRVDKLYQRKIDHPRARKLNLSSLLYHVQSTDDEQKRRPQNHKLDEKLDHRIITQAYPALTYREPVRISTPITNHDRTFATMLSSRVVKTFGAEGLPADTIVVSLKGTAGQSLGAFLAHGITLDLQGEANDYVGKGLSGGKIILRVPPGAGYEPAENIILGNTALFGATQGQLYAQGIAGERFAVRNSGALAVVEGVGNHGCEYMTGGAVVILGEVGRNFGAGMSGGEAYLYRPTSTFDSLLNKDMVHLTKVEDERDVAFLRRLLENHQAATGSRAAKAILDDFAAALPQFVKVMPNAYAEVIARHLEKGEDLRTPLPDSLTEDFRLLPTA